MGGDVGAIEFVSLDSAHNCDGFECTNREITQWVRKRAHREHSAGAIRVTCAMRPGSSRPLGIYALATVAEEEANLPGYAYHRFRAGKHFPALQLVWLATDKGSIRNGIGKLMVGNVIRMFADIAPKIGIPHLVLIPADADLIPFYADLGFEPYNDGEAMFLPIQLAVQAVANAQIAAGSG